LSLDELNLESAEVETGYQTDFGSMILSTAEDFFVSDMAEKARGNVQLILTSPPFPLIKKKRYGNLQGTDYREWIASLAPFVSKMLSQDGSVVIEIGNSWVRGSPTMSTVGIEALLDFKKAGNFQLCQQFIWHNPAKLPGPIQWVNIDRERVTDSFTNIWWLSNTDRPKADNKRVLRDYSRSMKRLLETGEYNAGRRPSQHKIGDKSFSKNNGGAIPSNVLSISNTSAADAYNRYCRDRGIRPHPARMPAGVAGFFIDMLTDEGDTVLDPFAGSNMTGAVAESKARKWLSVEPDVEHVVGSRGRFEKLQQNSR
jgi:DNA modification methylase